MQSASTKRALSDSIACHAARIVSDPSLIPMMLVHAATLATHCRISTHARTYSPCSTMRGSLHALSLAALSFADQPTAATYRDTLRYAMAYSAARLAASDARRTNLLDQTAPTFDPSIPPVRFAPIGSIEPGSVAGPETPRYARLISIATDRETYQRQAMAQSALTASIDAIERVRIDQVPRALRDAKQALAHVHAATPTYNCTLITVTKRSRGKRGKRGGKNTRT